MSAIDAVPITNYTIGGTSYPSYATIDDALAIQYDKTWVAENDANREIALVFARQHLDRLTWLGTPTNPAVAQWPRTGINDVDPSIIPKEIRDANAILAQRYIVSEQLDALRSSKIQMEKIGPKAIMYFSSANDNVLAQIVGGIDILRLIRPYLKVEVVSPNRVIGNDGVSLFGDSGKYNRTIGIS